MRARQECAGTAAGKAPYPCGPRNSLCVCWLTGSFWNPSAQFVIDSMSLKLWAVKSFGGTGFTAVPPNNFTSHNISCKIHITPAK